MHLFQEKLLQLAVEKEFNEQLVLKMLSEHQVCIKQIPMRQDHKAKWCEKIYMMTSQMYTSQICKKSVTDRQTDKPIVVAWNFGMVFAYRCIVHAEYFRGYFSNIARMYFRLNK